MTEKESRFTGVFEKTGSKEISDKDKALVEKANKSAAKILSQHEEKSNSVVRYAPMMALPALGATIRAARTQQADRCKVFEDTILQGLDQWLPDDEGKVQGTYYPLSAFEPTASEWGDGVRIVFAAKHPKVGALGKDEDKALKDCSTDKVKARIVGQSASAEIVKKGIGRPVLKVSLGKICDPEVQKLFEEARIGISSGFECDQTEDGKYILGEVHPDHILLFPRDALRGAEQRDMTAMVNAMIGDLEDENVTDGTQTNKGAEFSGKNRTKMLSVLQGLRAHMDSLANMLGYDNLFHPVPEADEAPAVTNTASKEYPYVPHNPPKYGKSTGSWAKPTQEEFEKAGHHWDDPTGKTFIQSCFAAVTGETFGDCRLPHHEPDGKVNANGVRNALARFTQTQGLGTASDAAKSHLESHLAEFQEKEKAGEESQENTPQETNMVDQTNKKASAEDRMAKFRKMVNEMKEAGDGEDITEENMQKYAKALCEMSGMPAMDDKGKEVPKNNKAKAVAKTDEELGDEADGKDDTAAEAKERKAKELLEEADAEEGNKKKNTAQNARLNALEQKIADMEAKDKTAKKRDFTNMLKPGYAKQADQLFTEFTADPITFMRTNQGMFAAGAGETQLEGLEFVPEGDPTLKGKSIAQMNEREFGAYVKQKAALVNARMDGTGNHSTVGTSVRRDPNNPGVFHANMLGQQEGQ